MRHVNPYLPAFCLTSHTRLGASGRTLAVTRPAANLKHTASGKALLVTKGRQAQETSELVQELQATAASLMGAVQRCVPPAVAHAGTQADDGGARMTALLQEQVTALSGQKAQLLIRVSEQEAAARVVAQQLQATQQEVAGLRQDKTQLLVEHVRRAAFVYNWGTGLLNSIKLVCKQL